MSDVELRRARDLGVATYLSAYVNLMTRELGMVSEDLDSATVNDIAMSMADTVNLATQAAWYALMNDKPGTNQSVTKLQTELERLGRPKH